MLSPKPGVNALLLQKLIVRARLCYLTAIVFSFVKDENLVNMRD